MIGGNSQSDHAVRFHKVSDEGGFINHLENLRPSAANVRIRSV